MSTVPSHDDELNTPDSHFLCPKTIERWFRLWSGLVLMIFVTSHLLNHALGIFGLDVMGEAQEWRVAVWRSWPGTILLFGAFIIHVALALRRVVGRRTWRMPPMEAAQIILGILIPFFLLTHVVDTRALSAWAGIDDSYVNILRFLWPDNAILQSVALVIVWGHGVIGVHYAFHVRRWYRPAKGFLAILAVLIPVLALAGFVAAGREAAKLTSPQEAWTAQQIATHVSVIANARLVMFVVLVLTIGLVAFRFIRSRLNAQVVIRYTGHGEILAAPGLTLLEISRANNIPHPSACGGRARCSSCRVLVSQGQGSLEPPTGLEQRMLDRIRATKDVRLACQIRPKADLSVRVLLETSHRTVNSRVASEVLNWGEWGIEDEVTILFADMRGFATLAQHQLPSDLIILLNRIIGEMTQAIESRDGRIVMIQTDGMMAVFGTKGKARAGARAALHAAADIFKAVHLVNKDIRAALPLPIRVGIGIHSGEVILSQAEENGGGQRMVVIGEAVVIASRLEEVTKEFAADCVVSSRTIAISGISRPASPVRQVHYKNGLNPIMAHTFADRQELRAFLGRARVQPEEQTANASG
jgi:adenylate cyclase